MGALRSRQERRKGTGLPARPLVSRDDWPWLAVAVLIGVGLRIAWIAYVNVDPNDGRFDDSVFYHNAARLIAHGEGFVNPYNGDPTAHRPPAYPAVLSAAYALFGWHVVLAKGLNTVFAAATVVLTFLIGRRTFDRRAAFLGALALAFFPGQIYFSTLVYAETMFAMVFTLVLFLVLVWTPAAASVRWWQAGLVGGLIGVSALVRVEGAFLLCAPLASWAVTVRPWHRMARYAAVVAVGAALALAPWTVRNAVRFHEFIPLRTNAGDAIARALDPRSEGAGGLNPAPDTLSVGEGLRYRVTHPWQVPGDAGRRIRALYEDDADGIRLISHESAIPDWFRGLLTSEFVDLPLPPPRAWLAPGYEPPLTGEELAPWARLADGYFYAVGGAALLGVAVCLMRGNRASFVLISTALGWTLLFAVFYPVTRYHFALGPVISILAGGLFVFSWDALQAAWRSLSRAYRERGVASGPG